MYHPLTPLFGRKRQACARSVYQPPSAASALLQCQSRNCVTPVAGSSTAFRHWQPVDCIRLTITRWTQIRHETTGHRGAFAPALIWALTARAAGRQKTNPRHTDHRGDLNISIGTPYRLGQLGKLVPNWPFTSSHVVWKSGCEKNDSLCDLRSGSMPLTRPTAQSVSRGQMPNYKLFQYKRQFAKNS